MVGTEYPKIVYLTDPRIVGKYAVVKDKDEEEKLRASLRKADPVPPAPVVEDDETKRFRGKPAKRRPGFNPEVA